MASWGHSENAARYDDEPWDAHYMGRQEVRAFYAQLLRAMPDLHIDIRRRHASEDAIVLEVIIRGQHLGSLARTSRHGSPNRVPAVRRLHVRPGGSAGRREIYYDRATVLRQLGVFHEPESWRGRIATVLTHPVTVARMVAWNSLRLGSAGKS